MNETELWLWLANGLGACVNWTGLLEQYGSVEAIWEERLYLLKEKHITARQSDRLLSFSLQDAQRRRELHESRDIRILTWADPDYPAQLRSISTPPAVLYVRGDVRCLQNQLLIGVVGTRHPSAYGLEATRQICDGLAEGGAVLVSGLAEGLDSEAHKAALRHNANTVAVLGTDLDTFFPARNRSLQELIPRSGAVISEYPCGVENVRYKESFVQRNRIIAGLSRGLCVAEARLRSGTMSTVNYAMDYGRDIFAVPGSIFSELSEGTNLLLKEGAKPATCAQDILEEYGITRPQTAPEKKPPASVQELSGDLQTVYAALPPAGQSADTAALCEKTGLAPGRLMAALTRLEMRGLVRQRPGRRFEKAL